MDIEKRSRSSLSFHLMTTSSSARIPLDRVEFIERQGRKLHVITDETREYVFYGKLEDLADLLVGNCFFRVMDGLIINMDHIEFITPREVVFMSGITYAMGRNNIGKVRKAYKNYIFGYAPFTQELVLKNVKVAEKEEFNDVSQNEH